MFDKAICLFDKANVFRSLKKMRILQLCDDSHKIIKAFLCAKTMNNMIFVCRLFKNMYLKFWTCEQT